MWMRANLDEPFITGVGIQVTLGACVDFVGLLATDLHHRLGGLLYFDI